MIHLKVVFGEYLTPVIIMLQEVHRQSSEAILVDSWIRKNFVLSNVDGTQRYFTLMMVSRYPFKPNLLCKRAEHISTVDSFCFSTWLIEALNK
jgi:hypothetical protein